MGYFLIVASSGRMLAQAAKNAGLRVLVIDLYADLDTHYYAEAVKKITSLAITDLKPAIDFFIGRYAVTQAIYGSGFEYHPESLRYLESRLQMLGNLSDTFISVHNKPFFFACLDRLGIPHPAVSFVAPDRGQHWLIKPIVGHGGVGIRRYSPNVFVDADVYWQKYQTGKVYSVLFMTDGIDVRVIGFNTQSAINLSEDQEFTFSGLINHCDLSDGQKQQIVDCLKPLVSEFLLKGLNSLDFIGLDGRVFILEINPRPSASMQLYGADLLLRHIQACLGKLADWACSTEDYTGYQIVYANQDMVIPKNFEWPPGCMDTPEAGSRCNKGQPICSIIVRQKQAQAVIDGLRFKQLNLMNRFTRMEYNASVNKLTQPLVQHLLANADKLRLGVETLENGCTIIDAGIKVPGGLEAGRIIAEICLGGMGTVSLSHSTYTDNWPLSVNVYTGNPVLGCLGSQYAGWSLSHEKYYALGSGPARALARKLKDGNLEPVEELYKELDYQDVADSTVLVIENDALPPLAIVEKVAAACQIDPAKLTIIVTPTSSLAGGVQVVARVLEVAMHKAHALHFPLENIVDGSGSAPVCPPHPNFVKAMGRTNDAILFAGQVHLFVKGSDEAAEKLAKELPSSTSKDYGKPFAEVFKQYGYDFFKIDAMLFSPASVIVTAVDSGKSFRGGKLDNALLDQSFGL
ncbi:MAG: methenyltetrahydromethanopterin cyclohydrolase [Methylococcales bacterium]|nr:methenyltetrahydromethanopterin cyclohydrolase [Methylococcales bacterium]